MNNHELIFKEFLESIGILSNIIHYKTGMIRSTLPYVLNKTIGYLVSFRYHLYIDNGIIRSLPNNKKKDPYVNAIMIEELYKFTVIVHGEYSREQFNIHLDKLRIQLL